MTTQSATDSASSPLPSRGLIVFALLPLFVSLPASLRRPTPAPIHQSEPRPALAFTQYAVNFRRPALRPVIHAQFEFTNRGLESVDIVELEPSCDCLRPTLYDRKRTYKPGESGGFVVQMQTAREQPGPHHYSVRVKYNDPQPREELLTFRMLLPERKVTVEPPEVYFYQLTGQADERTIYVVDARDRSLQVTDVQTSSPWLTASVGPLEIDQDGAERTPIRLAVPAQVPDGRNVARVTIHTSDPEFRQLTVPVLIQGPEEGVRPVAATASPEDPPAPAR